MLFVEMNFRSYEIEFKRRNFELLCACVISVWCLDKGVVNELGLLYGDICGQNRHVVSSDKNKGHPTCPKFKILTSFPFDENVLELKLDFTSIFVVFLTEYLLSFLFLVTFYVDKQSAT